MADCADQWFFAAVCSPGDHLCVKDPQVFPAAASACNDDLVHLFALIQLFDGIGHLLRGFKPLHCHRTQQQPYRWPAPCEHIADVLQGSSRLAGNNTDAFRKFRQRLFVLRCKQALLLQFRLELFQRQLCGTNAIREHIVHVQLKCAVALIKGSAAAHDYTHSLFRAESKAACISAEHYRFDAADIIPQRKIAVPAARILYKICNLAAQGKVKQSIVGIQQRFYITVEC